jgi:iron complex outermembrane receptor protein
MIRLYLLLIATFLYASEPVESLLSDIESNSDLSKKTKLENSGIVSVYTRKDLEKMQVTYLKDIIKYISIFGYAENRYGVSDPLTHGNAILFDSSRIKVYIDNQEITAGIYGSGIIILGDLNIGFVDHIEVYTQSPTFRYSIEPTLMLIKLYSKTSQRDDGSKVELNYGSYNAARLSAYNTSDIDDRWSYFVYGSTNNDKREKHSYHNNELSRDGQKVHLFATLSTENQHLLLNATHTNRNAFIGLSLDATPEKNKHTIDSLHAGYDISLEHFSFLFEYDYFKVNYTFRDDVEAKLPEFPIYSEDLDTLSSMVTTGIEYKKNLYNNALTFGFKHRYKYYVYTEDTVNGIEQPARDSKLQSVVTLYVEDQFALRENLILTAGVESFKVENINAKYNKKSKPFAYRYGITYLQDKWIFKLIGNYTESYLEPYLVDSDVLISGDLKSIEKNTYYTNIIYNTSHNKYELILGEIQVRNYLIMDQSSNFKLYNNNKVITADNFVLKWNYNYNKQNKLATELRTIKMDDEYKYKVILRSLNSYKKYDVMNELIYDRDSMIKKNYYDYTMGIIYHYNEDLKISLKAENIFDDAKETAYMIKDTTTLQPEDPLLISSYDRKITFSLEYLF